MFGTIQLQFEQALVLWGRACKDALARICQWHKDRGDTEIRECRELIKP